MKTLIVYYSPSGQTRTVAHALAFAMDAELEEIEEPDDRHGILGYLRSGRDALKRIPARIMPTQDPAPYDLVVIGTPVSAGRVSAPVRTYLTAHGDRLPATAFFCTIDGRDSDKAFAQMEEMTGKPPLGTMVATDREIASGMLLAWVEAFAVTIAPPRLTALNLV